MTNETTFLAASDIVRETEKAICVNVASVRRDFEIWLPKSMVAIEGGVIAIPTWFARKKGSFIPLCDAVAQRMMAKAA